MDGAEIVFLCLMQMGIIFGNLQLDLVLGSYEYKFSADNWNIAEDLDSTLACVTAVTDSTGTFVNRTLVVSNADIVLPVVYWNGCSTAPVSGCTDSCQQSTSIQLL